MIRSATVVAALGIFVISLSAPAIGAGGSGPVVIQPGGSISAGVGAVGTGTVGPAGTVNLSPKTKPIEVRRRQVMQILRLIQPNQQNTRVAEAALVAAGKDNLPILQALKNQPEHLVDDEDLASNTYATTDGVEFTDMRPRAERAKDLIALRLKAVETVINQFVQGFDPAVAIEKWAGGNATASGAQPLKDADLAKLFPEHTFYSLLFRMYPVAMMPPEPFKQHNLFAIDRKGGVAHMSTKEELEGWFRKHLGAVKDEAAAKSVMRAWMACAEYLVTDGMYHFTLAEDALIAEKIAKGLKASGRLDVAPGNGNRGTVSVTITFNADGKFDAVSQEMNLKAGMRPICQSTKLLDPDPIVRRMAEDSLRIMGADAFTYLMDQRARSIPELQQAIDRIMQQIINGD
jgi:hypothetical protein